MTDIDPPSLPELDDMLQSLLLIEEGEHEFDSGHEDVQELRQLFFPVTRNRVYLDHAALGPLPRPVVRTLHEYVDDISIFGSAHTERWQQHEQGAHRRLAAFINARPDQIILPASASESFSLLVHALRWQPGDNIISVGDTTAGKSLLWSALRAQGVQTMPLYTTLVAKELFAHINARTRLVHLSLVDLSTGVRNAIAPIVSHCHEHNILCGIDAMQALGALQLDVQGLGVDYMLAGSHQWMLGPHTSGILYLSDHLRSQLPDGFGQKHALAFFGDQAAFKRDTSYLAAASSSSFPVIGLDAALGIFESLDGGMQAVEERILGLIAYALTGLERLGYPILTRQDTGERSGIAYFAPHPARADLAPQQLAEELAARDIFIAAQENSLRISPHFYNTLEEIDTLLNALEAFKQPPASK